MPDASTLAGPRFDNSYARLPDRFHARLAPTPVRAPVLIRLNAPLARLLGLDPEARTPESWAAVFSGNERLEGSEPLAMAYAGHQFGNFVPQLGDGRALLLGEVTAQDGIRRDIQLKGSGRTPFSRMGDGRAALGPVLREYLVSEAMHALGIPTTRALAAVATGEPVMRETALPGAVLTRVARGHLRVGSFQYFAARDDEDGVRLLADYAIRRHHPELADADAPQAALLAAVVEAQARLVAGWMGVGFIHGVMNTDNMSIAGETIDYGPCAFMDAYDPATVFSSIDVTGRYAYGNQPRLAQWNLCRLAEALLPLIDPDPDRAVARATEIVEGFGPAYEREWARVMRAKLGLEEPQAEDARLATRLLGLMEQAGADFTLSFRALAGAAEGEAAPLLALIGDGPQSRAWLADWRARLSSGAASDAAPERLRHANPALIPRNHRIEQAIAAAVEAGDLGPFHRLAACLSDPFAPEADALAEAAPPAPQERVSATFCGT